LKIMSPGKTRQIIRLTRRPDSTRGIINPPALVRQLKQQGLVRREQYRFNTYGRAGESCHFCSATIEASNLGGRKMYFCPGCQPLI
jgi:endonuclease-8